MKTIEHIVFEMEKLLHHGAPVTADTVRLWADALKVIAQQEPVGEVWPPDDSELPGMWERADFSGGETDALEALAKVEANK